MQDFCGQCNVNNSIYVLYYIEININQRIAIHLDAIVKYDFGIQWFSIVTSNNRFFSGIAHSITATATVLRYDVTSSIKPRHLPLLACDNILLFVRQLLNGRGGSTGHLPNQVLGLQGGGAQVLQLRQFIHNQLPPDAGGPGRALPFSHACFWPKTPASISATSASVATVSPASLAFSSLV